MPFQIRQIGISDRAEWDADPPRNLLAPGLRPGTTHIEVNTVGETRKAKVRRALQVPAVHPDDTAWLQQTALQLLDAHRALGRRPLGSTTPCGAACSNRCCCAWPTPGASPPSARPRPARAAPQKGGDDLALGVVRIGEHELRGGAAELYFVLGSFPRAWGLLVFVFNTLVRAVALTVLTTYI